MVENIFKEYIFLLPFIMVGIIYFKFRKNHLSIRLLTMIGLIGFVGTAFLPRFGDSLWWLQLPTTFETTTIEASDGRRYSATTTLQRIQRYSPDGKFEKGWFVNAGGGVFVTGFTENGELAVASARGDHIEIFSPDGTLVRPPIKYNDGDLAMSFRHSLLQPDEVKSLGLSLVDSSTVKNPLFSLSSLLLFPFWHPVLGWLLIAAGMILAGVERYNKKYR